MIDPARPERGWPAPPAALVRRSGAEATTALRMAATFLSVASHVAIITLISPEAPARQSGAADPSPVVQVLLVSAGPATPAEPTTRRSGIDLDGQAVRVGPAIAPTDTRRPSGPQDHPGESGEGTAAGTGGSIWSVVPTGEWRPPAPLDCAASNPTTVWSARHRWCPEESNEEGSANRGEAPGQLTDSDKP